MLSSSCELLSVRMSSSSLFWIRIYCFATRGFWLLVPETASVFRDTKGSIKGLLTSEQGRWGQEFDQWALEDDWEEAARCLHDVNQVLCCKWGWLEKQGPPLLRRYCRLKVIGRQSLAGLLWAVSELLSLASQSGPHCRETEARHGISGEGQV